MAKTTTFERCMNLKPQNTKVHLFKFMVNCFFSHVYQVCISKRFFHSRSGHFTFGSDCTVHIWHAQFVKHIISTINNPSPSHLSAGKSLGLKPSSSARVLYCLSFFSADKRSSSGIYCGPLLQLSALRLERCTAAIIFPHNTMAQKITE